MIAAGEERCAKGVEDFWYRGVEVPGEDQVTHQDPGFLDVVCNKSREVCRIYLPPDVNSLLCVADHCLRSSNYFNVIVCDKQKHLQYMRMDQAMAHCAKGLGIWPQASNDQGVAPDVVMACAGDVPTKESLAAVLLLREHFRDLKIRFINVVDLFKLAPDTEHPHGLSDRDFDSLFTTDKPIIFNFHGYGVTATRVTRGDIEVTAAPELRLRFGDVLQLVGRPDDLAHAAETFGNSLRELDKTHFIPLFVGVAIGVVVGVFPIKVPGLSAPVRLGLAAGPLTVAIVLSWAGNLRGLVWHVPLVANRAFRQLGVALFLSAVGLAAGERFFATLFTRVGLTWLLCGVVITTIPLILLGTVARGVLNMNFTTLSGLIAGTMTDTNALTFAGALTESEGPQVAYAAVYPFAMLLRVIVAQALALTRPSSGVNPIDVSTQTPLSTADADAPLPKWAMTSRRSWRGSISAARAAQYAWLSPWNP